MSSALLLPCKLVLVLWLQAKFGGAGGGIRSKNGRGVRAAVAAETAPSAIPGDAVKEGTKEYDAIVIGSGIGGLVAATQLAIRGARVIHLEKYVIPGGSSGYFHYSTALSG